VIILGERRKRRHEKKSEEERFTACPVDTWKRER